MGRTFTPKYRIEANGFLTRSTWQHKYHGRPTAANLAKWAAKNNESTQPGGCNEHVGTDCPITKARIVRQSDDVVIAEWEA